MLGGAWKMTAAKHLTAGALRFGELRGAVGSVTPRVLTRQLRELEADGLVKRTVYAEVPPRVDYALRPLGRTLAPLVAALDAWGAQYAATVVPAPERAASPS